MKQLDSDSDIVKNILNGKKDEYRYLVDKFSPMIFHIVRSFEKNDQEVKGMVQEIFVKAYTKLGSYRNNAKFSTWIYSIATNHCKDYAKNIRRKNNRFSEMENGFAESEVSKDPRPDEHVERDESKNLLLQAIASLPTEQSEPLLMKYRDGMSYKAISEQMHVSESALKVRVYRARSELKNLLLNEVL